MTSLKKSLFVLIAAAVAMPMVHGLLNPKNGAAQVKAAQEKVVKEKKLSSTDIKDILSAGLKERYKTSLEKKVDKTAKKPYILGYVAIDTKDWQAQEFFANADTVNKIKSLTLIDYGREHGFEPLYGVVLYGILYSNGDINWVKGERHMPNLNQEESGSSEGEVTADDLKYGGAAW